MMTSLYRRLMFMTLMPACFLAMVLAIYFSFAGVRALEAELLQRGEDIVRYMAPTSEYGVVSGNWLSLQGMVQGAVQQPDVRAAAVVNLEGRVVAVSGRVNLGAEYLRTPPQGVAQVASGENWIAFAAPIFRSQVGSDVFFEEDPATASRNTPEVVGQVFVELDKSGLALRQRELLLQGGGILIFALALAAYFVARLARNLVLPVARLADAVRAMADGHFKTRVAETSKDEVGELERGFNRMGEHIDEVHRTLQHRIDEATALLAYQARHDALTGLINRREFESRLENAIKVARSGGELSTVLFIDLDRFKKVNDISGHMAGDELLRQLSRQLQSRLRESDTLARLGGDEFGVLLPGCEKDTASVLAGSLCKLVAAFHFTWQDKIFSIGASIGLVSVDANSHSVSEVLNAGDEACYAAKAAGRNRVEVHDGQHQDSRLTRDPWLERMEEALDNNLMSYQAQAVRPLLEQEPNIQLFELSGMIDDRQEKPLPLGLVMEAAERYDLAHQFDLHLLQQAASSLCRAGSAGKHESLLCLLRVSGASMRHPKYLQSLHLLAESLDCAASSLCLMVSEEVALQYPSEMKVFCENLRRWGCRIGLDDFGGWMGSFSHLQSIAPDFIRITPSLVRDVAENKSSAALVRAVQEIAVDHGIATIAASVDDLMSLQRLRELGVDYSQGRAVAPLEPLDCWLEGAVLRHL